MFLLQIWLYIWHIDVQNWHIILVDISFDKYKMSFLISLINFGWKSILLDIRIATPACFLGPFDWKILFQPFTVSYMSIFSVEICSLFATSYKGSCFSIQSVTLCLFIDELSTLILKDINDQWLLIPVILLVVVVCVCFLSLGFVGVRLSIVCVFCVINFLGLEYLL